MKFFDILGQPIPLKFCALIAERLAEGFYYKYASPLYDISRETAAAILNSAAKLKRYRPKRVVPTDSDRQEWQRAKIQKARLRLK